jgi:hypothetical protein
MTATEQTSGTQELGGPPSTQDLMNSTKEPIPLYTRLLDALYLHWSRMSRES